MKNINHLLQKGWSEGEVNTWQSEVLAQGKKRNYGEIAARVNRLPANTHFVEKYAIMPDGNPVFSITIGDLKNSNPAILITGGVHGYEPSGTWAALEFAETEALNLTNQFNFVILPCISPWAYEYDQRWNAHAEDPNRLFTRNPPSPKPNVFRVTDIEECRHFMNFIESRSIRFACAIDLHETCDRDIELRILRANRFDENLASDYKEIPQGYYLTLSQRDTAGENGRQLLFGQSIINEVEKISPIASDSTILNGKTNYGGVILSVPSNGLMRTYLDAHADLVAVTEVYPDHPDMTPEKSIEAQHASIRGALNYVRGLQPANL